jgi:hypothetical protein
MSNGPGGPISLWVPFSQWSYFPRSVPYSLIDRGPDSNGSSPCAMEFPISLCLALSIPPPSILFPSPHIFVYVLLVRWILLWNCWGSLFIVGTLPKREMIIHHHHYRLLFLLSSSSIVLPMQSLYYCRCFVCIYFLFSLDLSYVCLMGL